MNRTLQVVAVLCLVGAGVAYGLVRSVAEDDPSGVATEPQTAAPDEPHRLPPMSAVATVPPLTPGVVRQAMFQEPPRPTEAPSRPADIRITKIVDGRTVDGAPPDPFFVFTDSGPGATVRATQETVTFYLDRNVQTAGQEVVVSLIGPSPKTLTPNDGVTFSTVGGVTVVELALARADVFPQSFAVRFHARNTAAGAAGRHLESSPTPAVTVVRPLPDPDVKGQRPLLVTGYRDSPFFTQPTPLPAPTGRVTVHGSYLYLQGRAFARPDNLTFHLSVGGAVTQQAAKAAGPVTTDGWGYELTLPEFSVATPGTLYVRLNTVGGDAVYGPIQLDLTPIPPALPPPTIEVRPDVLGAAAFTQVGSPRAGEMAVYRVNTRALALTATFTDISDRAGGPPTGLVFAVDSDHWVVPAITASGQPTTLPKVELRDDGRHVIRVAQVRGARVGTETKLLLDVGTVWPTVTSVSAPGFGQSGGVGTETITIQFDPRSKLNYSEGSGLLNKANYTVLHNEGAKDGNNVPTRETVQGLPEFDPNSNRLTLTVGPVVPGSYRVVVKSNPAIRDIYGNELFKAPGLSITDAFYETTLFTQQVDAPQPSVAVGVTLQTGKNAVFGEYTPLRQMEEGFNPSDRVETRVVRLYYNRDAHRVAQIVNRDVKSYNRQSVEVRRRAADRVRDDADLAQDERQRLERAAIQAATEARAAEAELQQTEVEVARHRRAAAQAQIDLSRRELELEQARRDQTRADELRAVRAATDPGADDELRRLDVLEVQIRQRDAEVRELEAVIKDATTKPSDRLKAEQRLVQAQLELQARREDLLRAQRERPRAVAADPEVVTKQNAVADKEQALTKAQREFELAGANDRREKQRLVAEAQAALTTAQNELNIAIKAAETNQDKGVDARRTAAADLEVEIAGLNRTIEGLDRSISVLLEKPEENKVEIQRLQGERRVKELQVLTKLDQLKNKRAEVTREENRIRADVLDTPEVVNARKVVAGAEKQLALARSNLETAGVENRQTASDQVATAEVTLANARRDLARVTTAAEIKQDEEIDKARAAVTKLEQEITATQRQLALAEATQADRREAQARLNQLEVALAQAVRERDRALAARRGREVADTSADPARRRVEGINREVATLRRVLEGEEVAARQAADRIGLLRGRLQAARQAEVQATQRALNREQEEKRLREEQFRREVAAAREDPDTYAPGVPESKDPVLQCSISVIGEALIQIRGPIKGLNLIRTMIHDMDSPVGQVRIAVHTIQVNGERAERMERVIANIQRYIDHSRFLTAQSAQMLRRAITQVAARRAEEAAAGLAPGCTQAERDVRYLYSFYGKDFIDELREIDSEFLRTGNKVLSLHSMDSTSLAAALTQMALAKNTVRAEILQEFMTLVARDLPEAELRYYEAGRACTKCDACKDKKFCVMAYSARFQSLIGFFNTEITGEDTLTPIQREFVKLAQIFKNRLITELQLRQRVTERALLEERIGPHYLKELREAKEHEDAARRELSALQVGLQEAIAGATGELAGIEVHIDGVIRQVTEASGLLRVMTEAGAGTEITVRGRVEQLPRLTRDTPINLNLPQHQYIRRGLEGHRHDLLQFNYEAVQHQQALKRVTGAIDEALRTGELTWKHVEVIRKDTVVLLDHIREVASATQGRVREIVELLRGQEPQPARAYALYVQTRDRVLPLLAEGQPLRAVVLRLLDTTNRAFIKLQADAGRYEVAVRRAELARRPLDEKKLLDLLVDETEDKYIELLEGTRATVANIDNYIKTLATALEDDFDVQFYKPAFRKVRESAATGWDVTLSQIESTSVLTNNRGFGKVTPAATFEFDLPKREIFLTEGFRSAKAVIDEYGALVTDPSFLALAKMYSGQPMAATVNTGGGLAPVRSVLPGLPSSADEMLLAQAGPGRREFGSALEALIPDPAVYKFETGTGYEIRPVLSPDGQAVVFNFLYLYSTDVREPVRADEKHLGRVKRHFVNTDVQLSNYELREVSRYQVGLKAARTAQGVQLLQDIPGVGVLFRPLPSAESSLQENLIYTQATIFPTLFDLMGLRFAPAVADFDPLTGRTDEAIARWRQEYLNQRIVDRSAARVDSAIRIPPGERRADLYRRQVTLPAVHPNGYRGPGYGQVDGHLQEGPPQPYGSPQPPLPYDPQRAFPQTEFTPKASHERSGGLSSAPLGPGAPLHGDPLLPSRGPAPGVFTMPGATPLPPDGPYQVTAPPSFMPRPVGTAVTPVAPPVPIGGSPVPPAPTRGSLMPTGSGLVLPPGTPAAAPAVPPAPVPYIPPPAAAPGRQVNPLGGWNMPPSPTSGPTPPSSMSVPPVGGGAIGLPPTGVVR